MTKTDIGHAYCSLLRSCLESLLLLKAVLEAYRKLNLYDSFAVKAVRKNSETVGYLPRQLLQITIFLG